MSSVSTLVLALLLPMVRPFMHYQKRIPNGDNIPFPCKPGKIWPGLGHFNDEGTGPRNPFGLRFEELESIWTKEFCLEDSDGDGFYNGLELGDPKCEWTEDTPVAEKDGLSHPGICDPWDTPRCKNMDISSFSDKYKTQGEWMEDVCQSDGLVCPALEDKDIMNITLRLPPRTAVPTDTTSYICINFNIYNHGVPKGRDFHAVALTPVLDNKQVVHHMALFGCKGYMEPNFDPYMCQIVPNPSCQEFLHVWTVGLDGECYYPDSGVRIGETGVQFMVIQYHWTNMQKIRGLTDSSGLMVHFTPNFNCASGCTRTLIKHSINITSAWNHMHLLGLDMIMEVLRNGVHVAYITHDKVYSYDSPQVKEPLELFPGDSIVTTCGFNTLGRKEDVEWGDGTLDEMCFGFITYYPRVNLTSPTCLEIMGL
ncbi:unnamed protein product, partial [Candidula unifasciata]